MNTVAKLVSIAAVLTSAAMAAEQPATNAAPATHRADWLHRAQWGIFIHVSPTNFISAGPEVSSEEWNRQVDAFNVTGLAKQIETVGAGYFVITFGQNTGHYCAPNAAYDRFSGDRPSKCSRRDLVAELHAALAPKGVKLMVYLPCLPAGYTRAVKKAFGLAPDWWAPMDEPFARKWAEVISEWSVRYGTNVAGWWFDGAYDIFRFDETFARIYAEAARAGNSSSIVAFNPGVKLIRYTQDEDYTAGEINDPRTVRCTGRRVKGAQWHMLTYLGAGWGGGEPRFSDAAVIKMTRSIVKAGGAVTWEVPHTCGLLREPFVNQLVALRKGLASPPEQGGKEGASSSPGGQPGN